MIPAGAGSTVTTKYRIIGAMDTAQTFAETLINAYLTAQPARVSAADGPLTSAQAYAAQAAVWRAMGGTVRPVAWKIGAAAVDAEPLGAPIFADRLAQHPSSFPGRLFTRLGVEAEIAFCFGRDLPPRATPYRRSEILDAIASAHVAMELVDSRLADPEAAGPLWRLADNLLNGALVIGTAIPNWREIDFAVQTARVHVDAQLRHESLGRPPLDDLLHCIPWWLEHVGGARSGDIVTTGAWNGMHPVPLRGLLRVEFPGLGEATARIV
jgi:2-keto-4-pentenoate hydratase